MNAPADAPIRVLLIEDDLVDELATLRTVSREGLPYQLQVARTMARARAVLQAQRFDVILADYQLGDGTSFDLMDAFGDQLVIFITGAWDPAAAAQALRLGVHDYLIKDLEGQYLQLLHYRIETALRQRRLAGQLRDSEARLQATLDTALRAQAAAEAANAAKSAFLSNISHEIRTPLNAVIGVTHLLAESSLSDDQRRLLHKAQLAGRSLLGIVNDVLDLAKIEAGEVALDEAPYQPAALLAEIEAVYAPQARDKGLTFTATASPDLPAWLQGDSTRLRQVLVNLVANALKFTDSGGVEVALSLSDRAPGRCRLRVSVRDSGIGIERSVQDRLFSPFIQADASTTRRYGGTGLGLSIVKRLAQIMGGEVGLDSTPGQGSTFWVAVPQALPGSPETATASRGLRPLDVLVVDDDPQDRLALTSQVRALGWQALALESGPALLQEMARRDAAGLPPPDVMLVDWQMPGLDGLQALAALVAASGLPGLPAALLVAAHERASLDGLDHAGLADHILTKPVGSSALFNAVNDSLARRQGSTDRLLQSTRVDAPDTLWLAGLRVLLVDDSDINLEVARRLLSGRGAQVRTCGSAREALDSLRASPTGFDAVLMDVQMPGMDGLEATRRLRTELGLLTLPVIALTAGALVEERRRAFEAGMQGFLSKPLDPVQLVRMLRGCIETARGAVMPVAGLTGPVAQPPAGAPPWPPIEGIDSADAAQRLGGDRALFVSLLRQLLTAFDDLRQPSEPAFAGGVQRQALRGRMHKLRGSAGTLGARELHDLAQAAEQQLRAADADASAAVRSVAAGLARLAAHSAAALAAPTADGPRPGPSGDPPPAPAARAEPQRLHALLRQLRAQDLAAIDSFEALLPTLRSLLGAPAFGALSAAVADLDFPQACSLLSTRLPPLPAIAPAPMAAPAIARAITD